MSTFKSSFLVVALSLFVGLALMPGVACSPGNTTNNQNSTNSTTDAGGTADESSSNMPPGLDIKTEQMTKGETYKLSYVPKTSDKKVPLNDLFELEVTVLDKDGNPAKDKGLMVNSCMPDHNHCMFVKPEVEKLGDGKFLVKGLKFHMQGHWEIYADVTDGKLGEKECGRACSCTSGDCATFNVWLEF